MTETEAEILRGRAGRWRQAFMVEAGRAETGANLAEQIEAAWEAVPTAALREAIRDSLVTYRRRYAAAERLPAALDLLDDSTRSTLLLAGLKLVLNQGRDGFEQFQVLDDMVGLSEHGYFNLRLPVRTVRALAALLDPPLSVMPVNSDSAPEAPAPQEEAPDAPRC